jgi:hypothetical protein
VSLFVLSPEIEDRDEDEVATGRSAKRPSILNDILFYLQAHQKKKIEHELIYLFIDLFFPAVTLKLRFSNLQFSNFKAPVITSPVVILLVGT